MHFDRKEGGKPFQKVLDTLLEIDPDGDLRPSKKRGKHYRAETKQKRSIVSFPPPDRVESCLLFFCFQ